MSDFWYDCLCCMTLFQCLKDLYIHNDLKAYVSLRMYSQLVLQPCDVNIIIYKITRN